MKLGNVAFLEITDIEEVHAVGLAVGGGSAGIRDVGLLASAVMSPRTGYYPSLAELAAAYAFGLAKNHAFVDGNKRAALGAAVVFLEVNGYPLTLQREKWRAIMEGVASGSVARAQLAAHLADEMGGAVALRPAASPADATLLDVLIDGFEKNEIDGGFHYRDLPMPDEPSAVMKFEALSAEAVRWMGAPVEEQHVGPRRRVRWPGLQILQAGRGIRVRVRQSHFSDWWHGAETWKGDPLGEVRAWLEEEREP